MYSQCAHILRYCKWRSWFILKHLYTVCSTLKPHSAQIDDVRTAHIYCARSYCYMYKQSNTHLHLHACTHRLNIVIGSKTSTSSIAEPIWTFQPLEFFKFSRIVFKFYPHLYFMHHMKWNTQIDMVLVPYPRPKYILFFISFRTYRLLSLFLSIELYAWKCMLDIKFLINACYIHRSCWLNFFDLWNVLRCWFLFFLDFQKT